MLDFLIQYIFFMSGWGVANKGISFGISMPTVVWYLAFVLVLIIGYKSKLLLAGALGNLISRLVLGYVWDYIKIPFIGLWFNLSDVMIVLAVSLTIWKTK